MDGPIWLIDTVIDQSFCRTAELVVCTREKVDSHDGEYGNDEDEENADIE